MKSRQGGCVCCARTYNLNVKTNSRVFENNLKVKKDNSGENRRTLLMLALGLLKRLTHAGGLSIRQSTQNIN